MAMLLSVAAVLATTSAVATASAAPPAGGDPRARAEALLKQMTLEEKITLLHGPPTGPCCQCKGNASCAYVGNVAAIPRLKIPPITMNDGPQGFRDNNQPGSTTAWPSGLTMAASWSTDAMMDWGVGMGKEFYNKGSNVQLGPGLCLARVPRNGRNFEYLSGEDPMLGYVLSQPAIKGIQSEGVIANAKHYIMNDQETNRGSVSEMVDERTRYQMYLPPFAGALDADVGSIMCSYNKINGQGNPTPLDGAKSGFKPGHWSCENPVTLKGDLKGNGAGGVRGKAWEGFVMSDWGATHSTSIKQGLDIEMPGAGFMNQEKIGAQLKAGIIDESVVDESVMRILTTMYKFGVMDKYAQWDAKKLMTNVTTEASVQMARHLSTQSHVLIKNEGAILPLPKGKLTKKVAVLGLADGTNCLVHGGGSGSVVPSYIVSPLDGLRAAWGAESASMLSYTPGFNDTAAAAEAAKAADVAIVFVGTLSHEGGDRDSLSLDDGGPEKNQNALIEAVVAANPNTVVVMAVPGAILMPWSTKVKAIVTNFMPGQQAGHAIADVLTGAVNPNGKLPLTFPNIENETEFSPHQWPGYGKASDNKTPGFADYSEKLLVGYRYYDAHKIEFTTGAPFGHGLSYTTFKYSAVAMESHNVTFTLENSGKVAGAEVAQVYASLPKEGLGADEPPKRLVAFEKIELAPGASVKVSMELSDYALSVWDDQVKHAFEVLKGDYTVSVGSSSRDIRGTASFTV